MHLRPFNHPRRMPEVLKMNSVRESCQDINGQQVSFCLLKLFFSLDAVDQPVVEDGFRGETGLSA
eukprot:scaffold339267_cov13-Prasinocladus_malaysianus.AAC.1